MITIKKLICIAWLNSDSGEKRDLLDKPVLMLDGEFGTVIRLPTENHAKLGIQVPDEEDIRWRDPTKIGGDRLRELW